MSPSDLAGEYGCSNGHVRNVLSDLLSENVVARVGRGEYVAPPPDDTDAEPDVLTDVTGGDDLDLKDADEDAEQMQPDSEPDAEAEGNGRLEDGQARSEGPDGTGGDQEGDRGGLEDQEESAEGELGAGGAAVMAGGAGLPFALGQMEERHLWYALGLGAVALAVWWVFIRDGAESAQDGPQDAGDSDEPDQAGGGLIADTGEW